MLVNHQILLPLHAPILLKMIKSIKEILVDFPVQNIIPRKDLQLLNALPQLLQGPVRSPSPVNAKEQRDRPEWEPNYFPLPRDAKQWFQDLYTQQVVVMCLWVDDEGVHR